MKKAASAFVAAATIAGSLIATPASAQRGRYPSRAGPLLARPLRSGSWSIRRFWQLRMGGTAFLGRPWLAGPPGASLRLIRDCGEIERLIATLDSRAEASK
jgi:hypothetical protein